ncbi:colicin [Ralstonia syzygii]|uniref:Uncharacterized protein n=1 Tax=Ralstonia syzygii R24 TaxID=907261 RepID=G3A3M0_9RALS|nr:colicin [Ralstonia syzygii]CCA88477.1 conserved hypothetical protein [Ralstonia syzygii R24]
MSVRHLPEWLVLSVWRALLGEIYPAIRAIAISFSSSRELTIRYYLDREPTQYDLESIDVLLTNILAGAPEGQRIEAAFDECIRSESRLKDLDVLDGLVYARREY